MTTAARPKAPTSCETSTLTATHVRCDYCDSVDELQPGEWTCAHCMRLFDYPGDAVYEHHSLTPLGYRDDKACWWPPVRVDAQDGYDGAVVGHRTRTLLVIPPINWPERWVYYAMEPTA